MSRYHVVPRKITVEPFNMSDAEINIIVQQINIGILIILGTLILGAGMLIAFKQTRTVLTAVLSTLVFFYSIELIMLANMVKVHLNPSKYEMYRNVAISFATVSVVAVAILFLRKK